jgi:D-alanine-D-alanine ligase
MTSAGKNKLGNNDFGKVAVLMGGMSAEREISLLSGKAVLRALQENNVDAHGIDVDKNIASVLKEGDYDCAFIILHGRGGEDGTMQGLLSTMDIPYTGSKVLGSALAMDKLRSKQLWREKNLPTPDYVILDSAEACSTAMQSIRLPLIVKPVLEGSSIGMTKVEREDDLIPAWRTAEACGGCVIAERWIEGKEYTAAILGDDVLPIIRLETTRKFYDYEAKYQSGDTQYICPCGLDEKIEADLSELALQAFNTVGASGWGRVDFMIDENDQAWLIEVNTIPGMTDHSLVPMAAKQVGMDFNQLVFKVLETAHVEN